MKLNELSKQEQALWDAFPSGDIVDLRSGDPAIDSPENADSWGPERTIRAEVIAALLLGAGQSRPGRIPAVRIVGARITNVLDVAGGDVGIQLRLQGCLLEHRPDFRETACRTIDFRHCQLNGLVARRMKLTGHFGLEGSTCLDQPVDLANAHISGIAILNEARLIDPTGRAFWAGGLAVEGGVFGRHLVAQGEFRLAGARLGGGLFLEGAQLSNPGEIAFFGENIIVEGDMICTDSFTAQGTVRLRGAHINGRLSFHDAVLIGETHTLSCSRAHIEELVLTPAAPMKGALTFGHCRIGSIEDDPATWPTEIYLNGAVYDAIRNPKNQLNVKDRLKWVSRDQLGYRPQPYEQLAALYRRLGHDDDARRVLLAKQRHRRSTLRFLDRIWSHLLDWTVGYGYRPWLAALWLAVLLTIGTVTLSLARPHSIHGGLAPHFNPFVYTLTY